MQECIFPACYFEGEHRSGSAQSFGEREIAAALKATAASLSAGTLRHS